MQAAFFVDYARRDTDGTLVRATRDLIENRAGTISAYVTGMERALRDPRGVDQPGRDGSPLGIPPEVDGSAPGGSLPPDEEGSILPPPGGEGDGFPVDFCESLADLCAMVFQEAAMAGLNDSFLDLIATVEPDCICHSYDPDQLFTARPAPGRQFPVPLPDEVDLYFRNEVVTPLIVSSDPTAIQFRIPPGSTTGYVYLRALTRDYRERAQALGRACGGLIPEIPEIGHLRPSPGALLSIVYPPVIDKITLDAEAGDAFDREACLPADLCWSARLADQTPGHALHPCASIRVEVRDERGRFVHSGGREGCARLIEDQDHEYTLRATSSADTTQCSQGKPVVVRISRTRRIHLVRVVPESATVEVGSHGSFEIRVSCPAPQQGLTVELQSDNPNILSVPSSVQVPPHGRTALVSFAASWSQVGRATITARAAGHRQAQLDFVVERQTAIVLSGGGAKGGFQVGALKYFAVERWQEIDPSIVCGTSVGAINALPIAEGGGPDSVRALELVWLGLRVDQDMYTLSGEARAIELLLGIDIGDLLSGTGSGEFDLLPIPDFLAWLPIIGGIALDRLESTISDVLQIIRVMKSVYVLDPIREKIRNGVNFEAIPQSGKRLRLVSVCLEDGEIYYVTEQGRLFRGHAANPRFNEPLGGDLATNLTDGAIASAGIPVVFAPVVLSGSGFSRTCVDGGVREILPMQAAVELGAHRIIGISASPNRLERFNVLSDSPELDFSDNNLLDIGQRGLDLATFEVKRNEISPPQGHCDQIERIFVIPTFSVQETTTIDAGLILINMAYGYMRAFETYRWFSQGLTNGALWAMVDNTDTIIQTRRRIWELENIAVAKVDPPVGLPDSLPGIEYLVFDPTTMAEIRRLKCEVFAAVQRRFETWGAESLPKEFSDPTTGYLNTVLDWWETWERHRQPTENRLRAHDLWRPLTIALTVPVATTETNVPPKPVTPPAMRAALTPA